jgi:hypothetical protein
MRHLRRWHAIGLAVALLTSGVAVIANTTLSSADDVDCALRYVAGGDAVTWGKDADSREEKRYSRQLLEEHLKPAPGPWCEYNTSQEKVTTDDYVQQPSPSQQAEAWNKRPRLISLTLGRQNSGIVEHVTDCLQKIKDHDFPEANVCAITVLAHPTAWDELGKDLAEILNTYKVQMAGNPDLVVAVTGYFNPYPAATDVATKIPAFCAQLVDTIPTCTIRWVFLPPALITLDQVVKKLNKTIEEVVQRFTQSSQGRFVFVNPYDKFKDHCTEMQVEIKTKVYHPTNTVDEHNTNKTNFGCSSTWIKSDGKKGTKTPFLYLTPAVNGVLLLATQETTEMGIHPNEDGHDCISDLIWEATKHKLGVPEDPKEACS